MMMMYHLLHGGRANSHLINKYPSFFVLKYNKKSRVVTPMRADRYCGLGPWTQHGLYSITQHWES